MTPEEEEHRRSQSPSRRPGLCYDEMCTCGRHKCMTTAPSLPFEGSSTYRETFNLQNPSLYRDNWLRAREAANAQALRQPDQIPFQGSSTYRETYGPQNAQAALTAARLQKQSDQEMRLAAAKRMGIVGPDGLPRLDSNGNPLCILDEAGFPIATADGGPLYDSQGNPIPGTGIGSQRIPKSGGVPARLSPETRDFSTTYTQSYVKNPISICPAARLPRPPTAAWPLRHSFWDCPTRTWY